MQIRTGTRVPVQILDLRSDQRSNLSGLSRVAPPVLLGIEVIDFCFYGKTSHVPWRPYVNRHRRAPPCTADNSRAVYVMLVGRYRALRALFL